MNVFEVIEVAVVSLFLAGPIALGRYVGRRLVADHPIAQSKFSKAVWLTVGACCGVAIAYVALSFVATGTARYLLSIGPCIAIVAGPAAGILLIGVADSIRHRQSKTACRACGYELAGTRGECCPECGAQMEARSGG